MCLKIPSNSIQFNPTPSNSIQLQPPLHSQVSFWGKVQVKLLEFNYCAFCTALTLQGEAKSRTLTRVFRGLPVSAVSFFVRAPSNSIPLHPTPPIRSLETHLGGKGRLGLGYPPKNLAVNWPRPFGFYPRIAFPNNPDLEQKTA